MADTVATQTLSHGSRNVIMRFTNTSDGTGESAVTKVTASALAQAPDAAPSHLKISKIRYQTKGMGLRILWDATTPLLALEFPADRVDQLDFGDIGLVNSAKGTGGFNGNIKFTTVGAALNSSYEVTLHMTKKF